MLKFSNIVSIQNIELMKFSILCTVKPALEGTSIQQISVFKGKPPFSH
jgi:hypothetical protein